jgi:hypothetical protein
MLARQALSIVKFALISSKRLLMLTEKIFIILFVSAIMVEVAIGSIWSSDTRCQGLFGGGRLGGGYGRVEVAWRRARVTTGEGVAVETLGARERRRCLGARDRERFV